MKTMNKSTLALAAVAAFVLPSALAQTASDADAGSATGGNDILALLSDPVYAPFINIVRRCLTQPVSIEIPTFSATWHRFSFVTRRPYEEFTPQSQVLTDAPMCITDKAIIDGSFDLGKCPVRD